ncbi:MAG: pyridoxal 5'-phosphate synthase glutaminase subunit PdxT [Calditrichia bacterium]
MKIGVLALQGNFSLHADRLEELDVQAVYIKKPEQLRECDGLILPGGESTTLVKLLDEVSLGEAIVEFNKERPVFGTCAGAILVSREVQNHPVKPLNLLNTVISRNAYGRQVDSFDQIVELKLGEKTVQSSAVFIRAPKFISTGPDVAVLGTHNGDIIMVENERVLAATFHPELTDDPTVHRYFLKKVRSFSQH